MCLCAGALSFFIVPARARASVPCALELMRESDRAMCVREGTSVCCMSERVCVRACARAV